eukprot:686219_1
MQNHMKYYSITIVSPFGAYVVLIYLHLAHRSIDLLCFYNKIHIDIAAYYHLSRVDLQCFHAIASCSTMVTSYTSVRDCGLNDKLYNILLLFIQFFDCFVCFAFILILYVPCLFIVFY